MATTFLLLVFFLIQVVLGSQAATGGSLKYRGADISSLALVESQGTTFTDHQPSAGYVPESFEHILAAHGGNTARIRVWATGQYDLKYGLNMAKRVKAAGMTLVVDLHYSDTWADAGHQAIPYGWPSTLSDLKTKISNYTQNVVNQFAAQQTPIDILQVGNEINNGLLYPVGEISSNGIQPTSELLRSAIEGAKAAGFLGKTMIHLANAWDGNDVSWFFSSVFVQGALAPADVDMIGLSYYPFYDTRATLDALNSSLTNLANTVGKPIVIVETNWPVACPNVALSEPSIPVSVIGQEIWIDKIKEILLGLPHMLGQGIFFWEPGFVGNPSLGSSCADNLFVRPGGKTRASINIFGRM